MPTCGRSQFGAAGPGGSVWPQPLGTTMHSDNGMSGPFQPPAEIAGIVSQNSPKPTTPPRSRATPMERRPLLSNNVRPTVAKTSHALPGSQVVHHGALSLGSTKNVSHGTAKASRAAPDAHTARRAIDVSA